MLGIEHNVGMIWVCRQKREHNNLLWWNMGVVIGFVMRQRLLNRWLVVLWALLVMFQRVNESSDNEQPTEFSDWPSTASSSLLSAAIWSTVCALQKSAQYQLSTFLSIIRQFHEHNWHIFWAVQHSIIIKTLSTIGSALSAGRLVSTNYLCMLLEY